MVGSMVMAMAERNKKHTQECEMRMYIEDEYILRFDDLLLKIG